MTQAEVQATEAIKEITSRLDYIVRIGADSATRLEVASTEGAALAREVYRFLADPTGTGTDALEAAYQRFMSMHSGNFHPLVKAPGGN